MGRSPSQQCKTQSSTRALTLASAGSPPEPTPSGAPVKMLGGSAAEGSPPCRPSPCMLLGARFFSGPSSASAKESSSRALLWLLFPSPPSPPCSKGDERSSAKLPEASVGQVWVSRLQAARALVQHDFKSRRSDQSRSSRKHTYSVRCLAM